MSSREIIHIEYPGGELFLSVEPFDLHGGEEDVEEANHDDSEVQEVPGVPANRNLI